MQTVERDISEMTKPQPKSQIPIRVLHLEDNPADANLCLHKMRAEGLNVETEVVSTGKEFREKIRANSYDLVLGDYRLPDWSGLDAVHWLRISDVNTPFILVTGTLGEELAVECIKRGATDYVLKRNLDRLPLAVRRALQEQTTRAERDRAERELRQREQEYRSIVEGAPYGIYRVGEDGNLLMVNPALTAMLGYEREAELLKLNTISEIFVEPEERQRAVAMVHGNYENCSEHRWRRKDGKEIIVRIAGRKLPQEIGAPTTYEVFAEDITARRMLEEQFLQAQKMEAVGRLAGGVAHDFNNLLMIISGCLELWQHEKADPEKADRYIRQIREAASMAAFVVRQLLTFSRKRMVERHVVDMNGILKDLNKILPRLLGEDIEVIMVPGADLEQIEVDRGNVEQVVINLAVNARDAMPEGGKLTIRTSNVELKEGEGEGMNLTPGRYVKLSVTDTGTGMDAATQARIFEPFFTTKEQGKGTGLGLATVSSIVKQNAGGTWVHSGPGKGAIFEVYFPVAAALQKVLEPAKIAAPVQRGTETVMVVEDEAALRAVTSEYLESQGYTVLSASNGISALEICRRHPGKIHLLLTDVVMPGLSGPQVVEGAVAMRPELRVIYVSGYIDRLVDLETLGRGAIYLQKPYSLVELGHKIRESVAA
ncbi:MAG TPA: response regulator [Candidatus Angelobacter sp.]|nr:response regulator [Candidatus Angelobacter sp.]